MTQDDIRTAVLTFVIGPQPRRGRYTTDGEFAVMSDGRVLSPDEYEVNPKKGTITIRNPRIESVDISWYVCDGKSWVPKARGNTRERLQITWRASRAP
jgi:flagellar basal body rod protein FlgG